MKTSKAQDALIALIKMHQPVLFTPGKKQYYKIFDDKNGIELPGEVSQFAVEALVRKGIIEETGAGFVIVDLTNDIEFELSKKINWGEFCRSLGFDRTAISKNRISTTLKPYIPEVCETIEALVEKIKKDLEKNN